MLGTGYTWWYHGILVHFQPVIFITLLTSKYKHLLGDLKANVPSRQIDLQIKWFSENQ